MAKVPPVTNGGRFAKTDFFVELDSGQVTCPAGATTTDARKAKDHKGRGTIRLVFAAEDCAPPARCGATASRDPSPARS